MEWDSYRRELIERSDDWFWALGAISVFTAIVSLILGNILLAIIVGLAGFSIFRHEKRPLQDPSMHVRIDKQGVRLDNELYTYEKIRSFWVEGANDEKPATLILHYGRIFVPNIHIPIVGYEPADVRELMLKYGEEEKHTETFSEVIFETLGF